MTMMMMMMTIIIIIIIIITRKRAHLRQAHATQPSRRPPAIAAGGRSDLTNEYTNEHNQRQRTNQQTRRIAIPPGGLWRDSRMMMMMTMIILNASRHIKEKKLCYRKDDRAMRSIYGCPENFRDSLIIPTATFPNFFHGLLF